MAANSYTVPDLAARGQEPLMRRLLAVVLQHDTITYGEFARVLERELRLKVRVFPIHVGHVAGALMEQVWKSYGKTPPINALVVNNTGLPGVGVGGFLQDYGVSKPDWLGMPRQKQQELFGRVFSDVCRFDRWDQVYERVYGRSAPSLDKALHLTERDGKTGSGGRGGPAESDEHLRLKNYVAKTPTSVGLSSSDATSTTEHPLPSGDSVDVCFQRKNRFVLVEVKSIRSSEEDFRRGVYQCVKYRAVKEAELSEMSGLQVTAVLVTELPLPGYLFRLARRLGVRQRTVRVNDRAISKSTKMRH